MKRKGGGREGRRGGTEGRRRSSDDPCGGINGRSAQNIIRTEDKESKNPKAIRTIMSNS